MRTSLMIMASLLLLLLLATGAHGIRLDRQLHEAIDNKHKLGDSKKAGHPSNGVANAIGRHCTSDEHCSGKAQKPLAPHAEPGVAKHQINPKRNGEAEGTSHGRQEEARGAAPRLLPRQPQQTTYPDILDIAGMDYSPATRKPPIHN